jgi:hypothetical protein
MQIRRGFLMKQPAEEEQERRWKHWSKTTSMMILMLI